MHDTFNFTVRLLMSLYAYNRNANRNRVPFTDEVKD